MNFQSTLNEKIIYNNKLEKDLYNVLYNNFDKISLEIKNNNFFYLEKLIKETFYNNNILISVEIEVHENDGEPRGWWWQNTMHINLFHSDRLNKELMNEIIVACMHEYIHQEQDNRKIKKNKEKELNIPNIDKKKFSSHEIMAYANSFVMRSKYAGLTKQEVISAIENPTLSKDGILQTYYKYKNILPREHYNKFMKYVYYYIRELYA